MNGAKAIDSTMALADKRNISDIISTYSKRLMGFIRRRVSNPADAEDILQDVFYQLIGSTQPIEQLSGWLFTVTRNKIKDRQRKQRPDLLEDVYAGAGEDDFIGWAELFFDEYDTPENEYLRSIFWQELDNALNELPEEQRQVFVLHEMEDMPFKEIAGLTGETVNTLISRKRYAVLHLRTRLSVLRDELLKY